ncbi:hypothetical protein ES703_124003 [subsurface metagenome]
MKNNVVIAKRECLGCGEEFDSRTFVVFGVRVNFDRGYCPACRDKKMAELVEKEETERLAGIAKTLPLGYHYIILQFPPPLIHFYSETFESERQPRAYKKCLEYADRFPLLKATGYVSLVLFSPEVWGVGKTHLVCSIAHHILNRWNGEEISCPALFTTEPDLFRRIQATYNILPEERAWHETENAVFNHLIRVPLLILDDIGKDERSDKRFVQRVLFAIIDGRYKLSLPMVLTTNLSLEQLGAHLGGERSNEASYDRLVEMTEGKFVQLKGESYRRLKG